MSAPSALQRFFGPQGTLSTHLKGYEPRADQLSMAKAIQQSLSQGAEATEKETGQADTLLVEAETGLGKTLAYLVPAALSQQRVVVSTQTKNLQDQILNKEVPFIQRYLLPHFKALTLKGRQNYLCLYRWRQHQTGQSDRLFVEESHEQIKDWLDTTPYGDRTELPLFHHNPRLWDKICCLSHYCPGNECPDKRPCFLNKLRREAATADLLVVNHHLLFSDLALRKDKRGEVLPHYDAVIFDEAHQVEQVATTFFGTAFSKYQLLDLIGDIDNSVRLGLSPSRRLTLETGYRQTSRLLEQLINLFPTEKGRFSLNTLSPDQGERRHLKAQLIKSLLSLADQLEGLSSGDEPWKQYSTRSQTLANTLEQLAVDIDRPTSNHYIHWYERSGKNFTLSATPIDVATDLQATLFSQVSAAIFTSATLGFNGQFSYLLNRLGLPEHTPTHAFPSAYDYPNQTRLYVPRDVPEPGKPGHSTAIQQQILALINHAQGRALVLFTSFHAMENAYEALRATSPYPILLQGTAARHELLRQFQAEISSVLFGVASFWEGVDVPGEALSLVIIEKLPFEVPSDPVMMARVKRIEAEGGKPFFDYQIPRAILTLRQGVGRLMRSSSDRGIIAILDIRLFSKRYGRRFLAGLPPSPLCRDLTDVQSFYQQEKND